MINSFTHPSKKQFAEIQKKRFEMAITGCDVNRILNKIYSKKRNRICDELINDMILNDLM